MTDQEFIEAFEQGNIARFQHIDHVRMAWIYFTRNDPAEAFQRIISGIQTFAKVKNANGLYHETITLFWISVVFEAVTKDRSASYSKFIAENPKLIHKEHLFDFYSRDLVMSDPARNRWIAPDLRPLKNPFVALQCI